MTETSHPERVYFPADGITKGEVVDYYRTVAGVMVPYLEGRPLTLQRFPSGIDGDGFMQKNASRHFPESIERVEVPKEGGTTNHPLCDSPDDLVYLANQGTITFHVWTARLPHLDRPDRVILDLDPPDDGEPPTGVTEEARRVLSDAGLEAGLMTTGSRGYHVVALIEPELDYDVVGQAARLLAGVVAARMPEEATVEFLKEKRRGRVFVDWLRNRWAQSVVSPWSIRPRPRAPVAMPIGWDELAATPPDRWTIVDAPDRLDRPDDWPAPVALDVEAVSRLAAEHGVEADEPFDRFGRT